MNIAFIRIDKIGDLIATLPVDQIAELKDHQVSWVIAKGLASIANAAEPKRNFIELDAKNKFHAFSELKKYLSEQQPDMVVSFYSPWWVGLACLLSGIKKRVTRFSQWHSFLFFNKGLRQKRSLGEKHEAEYNLDLVNLSLQLTKSQPAPILTLKAPLKRQLFEKLNLQPNNYVVIHPGMAGSALNWPQGHFNQLIEALIQKTVVVITGTATDSVYLSEIKPKWEHHDKVRYLQNQLSMEDLFAVLNSSSAVVAPSTGVLQIAASLGKPSLGIYSPIATHHPRRWGPRGKQTQYFLPAVNCPAQTKCLGPACKFYPCMPTISVQQVLTATEKFI